MNYALLIIEADTSQIDALKNTLSILEPSLAQHEVLNVGAYMLSLEDGLNTLCNILSALEDRHLASRVLFFEDDPAWIKTPSQN